MGVGVFLRSFYQLKLKLFFSSIGTFSCCFPFCSEQTKEGWNFVCSNYHMTWSAFALFLARRTEFAFNISHFLMIFPFRFLTTFQVSVSLIFDIFWSHCSGWNSSVRVKIKEYVHALSEFLFVSLLVIFDFFFQINHFCYFTFLHGLQDVENHCAHLRDIELWRLVKKFHISAFPMYYSLYNWIEEHGIAKPKKYIFASNPEKRTQKQVPKRHEWNGTTQNGLPYLIFSAMRMRRRHLFCASSHHSVMYVKQQELNKGVSLMSFC